MKKVFALVAAAVLTVSLFAGCAKSQPATGGAVKYADGTYTGTYDFSDGKGWKPVVEVVIKDKKIASAKIDYVNAEGKKKTEDKAYEDRMKAASKNGMYPAEAMKQLNEQIVKSQDLSKIDGVTGATSTTKWFKDLAKAVLAKAEKGDKSATKLVMNDTYTATGTADERGWTPQISVTYKDGKIAAVVYDETDKDKKKKSEDADYNKRMKDTSKISFKEAVEKLQKTYLESSKVDTVTGATAASKKFDELVKKAIATRK